MSYKPSTKKKQRERWQKYKDFYPWSCKVDYRSSPEKYKVGKGEQGVLLCEPYKSEILPFWRFKNPEISLESSAQIFRIFKKYLKERDFVGADMARKFLQMGYTRARRYANHKGGLKYDPQSGEELGFSPEDPLKAESASVFYKAWQEAENTPSYKELKKKWKEKYG